MAEHQLNSSWVLWRHPIDSKDWSLKGYQKVATVSTVEQFWQLFNTMPTVSRDMWFFMREGIPPIWEHQINRQGGAFKFRVHSSKIDDDWLTLAQTLVGEQICCDARDAELISGISCSPKRNNFQTLSVWNLDKGQIGQAVFPQNIPGINFAASRYEAHTDRHFG